MPPLSLNPQALLTELGDGNAVVLHLETKFYFTLNATGLTVWKALGDGLACTPRALAEKLAAEYRVTPEVAERDVAALLDVLLREKLVLAG